MTVKCPLCGSEVSDEDGPVTIGDDGFPVAMSVREGLGVPVADISSTGRWLVSLDSQEVERCVAFDRARGFVWKHKVDGGGNLIVRKGEVEIEKLAGEVMV